MVLWPEIKKSWSKTDKRYFKFLCIGTMVLFRFFFLHFIVSQPVSTGYETLGKCGKMMTARNCRKSQKISCVRVYVSVAIQLRLFFLYLIKYYGYVQRFAWCVFIDDRLWCTNCSYCYLCWVMFIAKMRKCRE